MDEDLRKKQRHIEDPDDYRTYLLALMRTKQDYTGELILEAKAKLDLAIDCLVARLHDPPKYLFKAPKEMDCDTITIRGFSVPQYHDRNDIRFFLDVDTKIMRRTWQPCAWEQKSNVDLVSYISYGVKIYQNILKLGPRANGFVGDMSRY
jgi:hypothetical protein